MADLIAQINKEQAQIITQDEARYKTQSVKPILFTNHMRLFDRLIF